MFSQNPKDKEEAVPAIGNDGIRQYSMCGRMLTVAANEAEDAEAGLHWFPTNNINQSTTIVGMDTAFTLAATVRTGLSVGAQTIHALPENRISTSFFTDNLANDRVLSYHNNVFHNHASLESRALLF